MSEYCGYGVDLSELSFNNLRDFIKRHDSAMYQDMQDMQVDLEEDDPELLDEGILEYLDNYQNVQGYYGISAYLTDMINEKENLELMPYDDVVYGYIYVPKSYPWDQNENMKNLTQEKIEGIFRKYLSEITEEEIVCTNLVMYVDDFD